MIELVGRKAELEQLMQAYSDVAGGQARLVWIDGEPGCGKTRLVQEFYSALSQRHDPPQDHAPEGYWADALTARISADNLRPALPEHRKAVAMPYFWWGLRCSAGSEHNAESFQPFVDGIGDLDRHLGGMEAARKRRKAGLKFAVEMGEMLLGFTGLKTYYSAAKSVKTLYDGLRSANPQTSGSESEAREISKRTEDVFLRLIAALNDKRNKELPSVPVVIVLDDAQWADARSIAFARRLLNLAPQNGWQVLVVLSIRRTELAAQEATGASHLPAATLPELRANLARVAGAASVVDVQLPPQLDAASAQELLRGMLTRAGQAVTADALAVLQSRAGGQPFFLVNYALHALESGWLDAEGRLQCSPEELDALPRDIDELLAQRLRLLPPAELEALQWGSVQGRRFLSQLVEQVATELGRNAAQAQLDLGRARDGHQLISSVPQEPKADLVRYEFTHGALQQHVRASSSPEITALAQRCLQGLLAEYFDSGRLDLLPIDERRSALTSLADAPAGDADSARRGLLVTARLCRDFVQVQDYRAAEPWARQAAQSAADMAAAETLGLEEARELNPVFETFRVRGLFDLALEAGEVQLAVARKVDDAHSAARALTSLGRIHEARGDFARARELYGESLELNRACGAELGAALALGKLGSIHHTQGEFRQALELYSNSLAELERLGDQVNALRTLNNMGLAHESLGEYDQALELIGRTMTEYRAMGDEHAVAQTLNNMANCYLAQGDHDRAREAYSESAELLRRVGDEQGLAGALGNLGLTHELRGENETALKLYEESLAGFRTLGAEHGAALTLGDLGNVYRHLGDFERATKSYEESLEIKRRVGDEYGVAVTLTDFGRLLDVQGATDRAQGVWREAAELYRQCGRQDEAEKVEQLLSGQLLPEAG